MGNALTPEMFRDTSALFAERGLAQHKTATNIHRNIAYGSHDRHRLDIFLPAECEAASAILLYVHGGGFVQGDKGGEGSPYYGHIGAWAASLGMVGATMNYRLAPEFQWPAGAEDISEAIGWLVTNSARLGFAARNVFLIGQSAGAAHVASYVAMPHLHPTGRLLAGAIMLSGIYDVARLKHSPFENAYYGTDSAKFAEQSSLGGLISSDVPCLFSVAEYDGTTFEQQALLLVQDWWREHERLPRMLYLPDANHMSPALGLGAGADPLSIEIEAFIHKFSTPAENSEL